MTLLLDVPWTTIHTVQLPGFNEETKQQQLVSNQLWPFLGLLSQLSLRRSGAMLEAQIQTLKAENPAAFNPANLAPEQQQAIAIIEQGKYNHPAVDGLVLPELQQFAGLLQAGISANDWRTVRGLCHAFLETGG